MFTPSSYIRSSIRLASALTALGLFSPAYAAVTALADSPALDVVVVKPNVMFTLDTSGSMSWGYVPDQMQPSAPAGAARVNWVATNRCFRNSIANPLYYDPAQVYAAPRHFDAVTNTVTALPDVPFGAAPQDGYVAGGIVVNLALNYRANWEYGAPATGVGTFSGFSSGPTGIGAASYAVYTGAGTPTDGFCYPDASYNLVVVPVGQQQNFANWFSYYRSRMQAMKAASGFAFAALDDNYRVGFHNIWNTAGSYLNVTDFTGAQRQTWYNRLYASVPANSTPLRGATWRIGEYFRTGIMPGVAASGPDPVQFSCQGNYHILSTDGYWNDAAEPALAAPQTFDNNVPVLPAPVAGLTPGVAWPALYRENPAAVVGSQIKTRTLSDIATYYWATDLRPTAAWPNNVPVSPEDPASWQHVVMFGVSIAAQGVLPYDVPRQPRARPASVDTPAKITAWLATLTETERTLYRIQTGAAWPTAGAASDGTPWPTGANVGAGGVAVWPSPTSGLPSTIDDLWHATVNGRGNFFNVSTAQDLSGALYTALSAIASRGATSAGAALADANLSAGSDNTTYVPGYVSGRWTGELTAKPLDSVTGRVIQAPDPSTGLLVDVVRWRHSEVLDAQATGTGWVTNRKILTTANGAAVPFQFASLTAAQRTALGATTVEQQAVFNYLRGSRVDEDQSAPASRRYRERVTLLGDIVNSEPLAVTSPKERFSDAYNPGYKEFKTLRSARTPMVYFGANDGFIHAVNGAETGPDAGRELFAYMPSELLRPGPTGIAALTYKPTDNLPNRFAHRFYVDGQLVVRDVDFTRTSQVPATPTPTPTSGQSPDWRSVLVAGLGKGGRSYVALDVTNPVDATEATMVTDKRVLWEFTDPDMGFTYGKAVIAKTARYGWVALLPSGYNNTTGPNAGKGVLFVVDVKTGTLLHKFITPEGSAADPIGMAQINGFVPDVTDFTVTELYATDVEGNIWRFDLLPTTPYLSTGVKFAQLRNPLNQKQPITAYPVPYIEPLSGKRFVAVGTGKLFAAADLTDLSQQTIYNIQDGTVYEPKTTGLPIVRGGLTSIARTADQASLPSTNVGWYTDLRTDGERVVKPVLAQFGVVVAFTIAPSADPCNRGGVGTAYARGAVTGNNLITGTGNPWLNSLSGDPIITGRVIKTSKGKPLVQIISGSGKISTIDNLQFPGGFKGSVVNYREVIE